MCRSLRRTRLELAMVPLEREDYFPSALPMFSICLLSSALSTFFAAICLR